MLTIYNFDQKMKNNELRTFLRDETKVKVFKKADSAVDKRKSNIVLQDGACAQVKDKFYREFLSLNALHGSVFHINEKNCGEGTKFFLDIEGNDNDNIDIDTMVKDICSVVEEIFGLTYSPCVVLRNNKRTNRFHIVFYKLPMKGLNLKKIAEAITIDHSQYKDYIDMAVYKPNGCSLRMPLNMKCKICEACENGRDRAACAVCEGKGRIPEPDKGVYVGYKQYHSGDLSNFKYDEDSAWKCSTFCEQNEKQNCIEQRCGTLKKYNLRFCRQDPGEKALMFGNSFYKECGIVNQDACEKLTEYIWHVIPEYKRHDVKVKDINKLQRNMKRNTNKRKDMMPDLGQAYGCRLNKTFCVCKKGFHKSNANYLLLFETGKIFIKCFSEKENQFGNCKTFKAPLITNDRFPSVLEAITGFNQKENRKRNLYQMFQS